MKNNILIVILFFIVSCSTEIKNDSAVIIQEKGTEIQVEEILINTQKDQIEIKSIDGVEHLLGFWVGYFEQVSMDDHDIGIFVDDAFYWNRENKINISIDLLLDSTIFGHSVVAGNNRPFEGTYSSDINGYHFEVSEPGDDKYDGVFKFSISDTKLVGKWTAYKNIEIKNRKYELKNREYNYNPSQKLIATSEYIDWNNYTEKKDTFEYDDTFEEWIRQDFSTATSLIYEINASNTELTVADVENLKKGDLLIIRNTIYARHGYSFKNRPLRVFFDAQKWYIPVHNDIKQAFTELEKKNIELLLRYEENASEYYDYFGRG